MNNMTMDQAWVKTVVPHREPFLFIDEVLELDPGVRAVARWHITGDEHFFKGHFPGLPVLPGVLVIEALAQTGALAVLTLEENKGKIGFLAGVEKTRFRHKVLPGDDLRLEAIIEKVKLGVVFCDCTAYVGDKIAVKANTSFALGT